MRSFQEFTQQEDGFYEFYCHRCERTVTGVSTRATHNMRRHEYHPDIYGEQYYEGVTCGSCDGELEPTEVTEVNVFSDCPECGSHWGYPRDDCPDCGSEMEIGERERTLTALACVDCGWEL